MATTKQVLVLRKDLNMRKGKMVAQGAHASMAAILGQGQYHETPTGRRFTLDLPADEPLAEWLGGKFTKICVSVPDEASLLATYEAALVAGLPAALVQDSGLTEFGGVPTYTAVAVGPGLADEVDKITGAMPLL